MSEHKRGRGNARPKQQIESLMLNVLCLLTDGKTDKEIMTQLNLSKATYYRYKKRVEREAGEAFKKQRLEHIALHKEILIERLSSLYRAAIKILETESSPKATGRGFSKIAARAEELAIQIYKVQIGSISVAQSGKLEDMDWAFSSP